MNYNDVRKNENKGFSLVELIVVIAIMAVMTAVLAPSLLGYVEKSRAQKDDSAMGEVVNAIQIAMSEENVFNEVLRYSCYGNYSCYVDDTASNDGAAAPDGTYKVVTKTANGQAGTTVAGAEQYMFDDDSRRDDEVAYHPAGVMRGVTLTFVPESKDGTYQFNIKNAQVNSMVGKPFQAATISESGVAEAAVEGKERANGTAVAAASAAEKKAEDAKGTQKTLAGMNASKRANDHYLYSAVKSTVGDSITLSSKTYRNSEYTVFIRIGSTGGNSGGGDAIKCYGQWNGTNLPTVAD